MLRVPELAAAYTVASAGVNVACIDVRDSVLAWKWADRALPTRNLVSRLAHCDSPAVDSVDSGEPSDVRASIGKSIS
jgi:hypothetical protein